MGVLYPFYEFFQKEAAKYDDRIRIAPHSGCRERHIASNHSSRPGLGDVDLGVFHSKADLPLIHRVPLVLQLQEQRVRVQRPEHVREREHVQKLRALQEREMFELQRAFSQRESLQPATDLGTVSARELPAMGLREREVRTVHLWGMRRKSEQFQE